MATKILGVYETVTALNTAHSTGNNNGDTYIVGTKCPYTLYSWNDSSFKKGETVSDTASELSAEIPVDDLYNLSFQGNDGKTLKIRKGLHLGEIHFYVPVE